MKTCAMSFIKYLLFIFNLVFAATGMGIIIAGALILKSMGEYIKFVSSDMTGPAIVLIIVGTIIFIIASFGCFGAIRELPKLLFTFAGLVAMIFLIEIAIAIAAAVYRDDLHDSLLTTLKSSMTKYNTSVSDKKSWDIVQTHMICCGTTGPKSWNSAFVPLTCCHNYQEYNLPHSSYCLDHMDGKFQSQRGCLDILQEKIVLNIKILIGVAISIAFVQVTGVVLASWLAFTIRKEDRGK